MDVEARRAEEARERAAREVGAMLVIDVPERTLLEDPLHVRQLEEDIHMGTVTDGRAHQADEVQHRRDVLERVTTTNVVSVQVRILRAIEVANEGDPIRRARARTLRPIPRIEPDAGAAAALA